MEWENVKDADSYTMYYSNVPNFTKQNARAIEGIKGNITLAPSCSGSQADGLIPVSSEKKTNEDPNVVKFSINKVPPGSYHYRIVSVKGDKESAWSGEESVVVGTCQPYAAPTDLKKEIQENGDIKVTWSPDSTADGYALYVTSEDGSKERIIPLNNPLVSEHVLSDLDPNSNWFVRVSSFGTHCGEGNRSLPLQLNEPKE